MTENQTTTGPATPEVDPETTPSDAATTDALDSVTTTEQLITPDEAPSAEPADNAAEEASATETTPAENALADEPADASSTTDADDAAEEAAVGEAAPAGNALVDGPADGEGEDAVSRLDVASGSDSAAADDTFVDAADVGTSVDDVSDDAAIDADADADADADDASATVASADDGATIDSADDAAGDASTTNSTADASTTISIADVSAVADSVDGASEEAPFGEEEGVLSGAEEVLDDETMRRALEAILMVTDEPLPVLTLARTVGRPTGDVTAALYELAGEYTEQGRGFDLREVGGGWRYYTRADAAQYVERFVLDGQQSRLTQAALETLAVVAYKQPVSRARVSAIRGVNVDGVMRTLISRGLVEEAGADTESQATLYRTTSYFLERMGMQSLDDLPELAPYLPDMDDMEEELAAQNAPTTTEGEAVSEETHAVPAEQAETAVQEAEAASADDGDVLTVEDSDAASAEDGDVLTVEDSDAASAEYGDGAAEAAGVDEDEGAVMQEAVAGDGGRDDELEPAEELEAGGDEIETVTDPAEIPADEEDADGNDDDDESADFDAAVGDSGEDDEDEDDDLAIDAVEELDAADDEIDEDDESVDERLEAAEDLELAGVPDESDDEPVAGGSQYGTEANERNE